MKSHFAILAFCAFLLTLSTAEETPLKLKAISGETHAPLEITDKKAAVFYFVSPYCPTSNTFSDEMNAIAEDYAENFAFYYIQSDPSVDENVAIQHAQFSEFKSPVLMDEDQRLAKKLGAKITPEVVVVDANGETRYQGRINDLYLGPTKRQREATTRDLRDALEAIRDGKPVPNAKTEAVGCKIGGME